jgi:phosphatidyl-myo-inositol alpha-mannosyltransferase
MRVALVFPNYWPYVRRGAERLMVEYANYLADAGHEVAIVTSKPGTSRIVSRGNLTVYYEPRLTHPLLASAWPKFRFYTFTLTALGHLLRHRYDVVHIWFYTYGLAARLTRAFRGTPYLYQSMAEELVLPGPLGRFLVPRVIKAADRVVALTNRAAAKAQEELGIPVHVLGPCVDLRTFAPQGQRDLTRPRVLFASDPTDFRKGSSLLLMAWDEIHRRSPTAVLTFGGPLGQAEIKREVDLLDWVKEFVHDPDARSAIEIIGEGRPEDLPALYSRAAVTVLPSLGEVFGLVLVESLACGTPVVGSANEGPGEIISDPAVGATVALVRPRDLADPERAAALAEAVLHAIELAADPATADRCRDHARQWSRDEVGKTLERTYMDVIAAAERTVEAYA